MIQPLTVTTDHYELTGFEAAAYRATTPGNLTALTLEAGIERITNVVLWPGLKMVSAEAVGISLLETDTPTSTTIIDNVLDDEDVVIDSSRPTVKAPGEFVVANTPPVSVFGRLFSAAAPAAATGFTVRGLTWVLKREQTCLRPFIGTTVKIRPIILKASDYTGVQSFVISGVTHLVVGVYSEVPAPPP